MTRKLKKNERLVYAGDTMFHASGGSASPAVPQFKILPASEVGPDDRIYLLKKGEGLLLVGCEFNDMALARERFAALKAGHKAPPSEKGTPLYVVADQEGLAINAEEEKAMCVDIAKDFTAALSLHLRKQEVERW